MLKKGGVTSVTPFFLSEEDYNGLMETLYLSAVPTMKEKIVEGLHTPLDECVSENEVQW